MGSSHRHLTAGEPVSKVSSAFILDRKGPGTKVSPHASSFPFWEVLRRRILGTLSFSSTCLPGGRQGQRSSCAGSWLGLQGTRTPQGGGRQARVVIKQCHLIGLADAGIQKGVGGIWLVSAP